MDQMFADQLAARKIFQDALNTRAHIQRNINILSKIETIQIIQYGPYNMLYMIWPNVMRYGLYTDMGNMKS